eukprot:GABV01010341.1.p1 GENE.GABV01010341.1~~GABV01010341.1.p1  ORF type:complete len:136 (-),score=25.37 GABV01010341.1:41-448(-)
MEKIDCEFNSQSGFSESSTIEAYRCAMLPPRPCPQNTTRTGECCCLELNDFCEQIFVAAVKKARVFERFRFFRAFVSIDRTFGLERLQTSFCRLQTPLKVQQQTEILLTKYTLACSRLCEGNSAFHLFSKASRLG